MGESWLKPNSPPEFYSVEGYNVFSDSRQSKRGGSVLVYVNDSSKAEVMTDIVVPREIEVMWLKLSHHKLPRSVSYIVLCAVYIPPDSEHQDLLISHLLSAIDHVKTSQSQAGIIVLGDFNRTDIRSLCLGNGLTQVVNKQTREDAILDLIITDFSSLYSTPHVKSPVGKSDHNCVIWLPKNSRQPNGSTPLKRFP